MKYRLLLDELFSRANSVILGKEHEMKLIVCCLLARGHLLIEDVPGMGKTTLVKTVARLLGLHFNRIQFTSDLLPADILGFPVLKSGSDFVFRKGPIFAQLVLGDELNRASPRTQSATLQAMEESEVTVDGQLYALPRPFFFVATQNPRDSYGTFPLPPSQLDRFLMRVELGYPSGDAEKKLLLGTARARLLEDLKPALNSLEVLQIQTDIENLTVSPAIADYVLALVTRSRQAQTKNGVGLSPRGGIALLQAAKAWAFLEGRTFVIPEDIQAVSIEVMSHRLENEDHHSGKVLAQELLKQVPVV